MPRQPFSVLACLCTMFFLLPLHAATPLILSTDIGNEIDDQWAIAYTLVNPNFQVLGILSAHAPSIPAPAGYHSYLLLRDEVEHRLGMSVHPPLLVGADLPLKDRSTPSLSEGAKFLLEQSKPYTVNNRLTILNIGAATDVASAILADPTIVDRIRVVAMAFTSQSNAREYNVENDVLAWQILLDSRVPIVIGPGEVCRADLAMPYDEAKSMLAKDGAPGAWLWEEYDNWYYRQIKPLRKDDFSKPWTIWDIITMAYLEGFATTESKPRPTLSRGFTLSAGSGTGDIEWITHVDTQRLWTDFQARIHSFNATHATRSTFD